LWLAKEPQAAQLAWRPVPCNLKKPRISALLPSLGTPRTLRAAVRSTLFALGPNDELLVLISGEIRSQSLEKIKDSRLRVFFNPLPLKVFEALNILLDEAQGSLIARMDSDDLCLPWRFHSQSRKLQKDKLDFVFSNSILFGKSIKPFFVIPQIPISLDHIQSGLFLALSNPFVHPTMLATKSSLKSLGGYRALMSEDYDLWLRGWQAGYKFARTAGCGILYRIHSSQITQSDEFLEEAEKEMELQNSLSNQLKLLSSMGVINAALPATQAIEASLRGSSLIMFVIRSPLVKSFLEASNFLLGRQPRK
jgi:glycosyltransferase involved in cell wall biosynthesis